MDVVGDFSLVQKQPLAHKGRDLRYSNPVISDVIDDADVISGTEKYSFRRILQDYNERNGEEKLPFGGMQQRVEINALLLQSRCG